MLVALSQSSRKFGPTDMGVQNYPLDTSKSISLNAAGAGSAVIGPTALQQVWNVTNLSVRVSTAVKESTAEVYLGPAGGNQLGSTNTGSSGDSTDLNITLRAGNVITVVWAGGDANATATVSLYGEVFIGG